MSTLSNPYGIYSQVLGDSISRVRRRTINIGAGTAIAWGIVGFISVVIACAAIDLLIEFESSIRMACLAVAAGVMLIILFKLARRILKLQASSAVAQRLDDLTHSRGQISTGVDLATTTQENPMSAALAVLAVRQASEILSGSSTAAAVPTKAIFHPVAALGGILVAVAIIGFILPRLVATQFMRFADPFGDHPAYSPVTFNVTPGNLSVVYGNSADIAATVAGGSVDKIDVVLANPGGDDVLPMFPSGPDKWTATISGVVTPHTYFIRSGRVRSKHFQLGVITIPKLTDVKFHVQLPDYTNRPPYEGPLPQNGLAGLAGTTVEIHAKSNRPLSGGVITINPVKGAPLIVDMLPLKPGDSEVSGKFQIQFAGALSMKVTDVDGQDSSDALNTSVTLLKDEKPFVRLIEPKATGFATPDAVMKIQALAEDDYGVSAVSIFKGINGGPMKPTAIPAPPHPLTQWPADLELSMTSLGVAPGDEVQLFARATDNDPAGGKSSDSSVATLKIVSQKEMDQMMIAQAGMETLQNKYSAAERRLEAADDELAKLEKQLASQDPESTLSDEIKKKIGDEANKLAKAAAEINKLANHPLPFDLDHALQLQLKQAAAAAAEAAKEAKETAGKSSLSAAGALDQIKKIRKQLGEEKEDFDENATAPLEHLARIVPLIGDQARFLDLYARQRDLSERLASAESLKNKDDPKQKAQMRDFGDEQRGVQQDLKQLLDDVDNHIAQLPEDPKLDDLRDTAKKFVDAVRPSPADAQMGDAESSLEDFEGLAAHSSAKSAADTLNQFIGRCQSVGGKASACLKFQPKLAAGLGNTVQQMLSSMSLSSGKGGAGISGYTANRASLANASLYGTIPMRGQESRGGGGDADHGVANNANGLPDEKNSPDFAGKNAKQRASGGTDAPVPAEYKKRVGEYFQRVNDELSK